jgi:hypothetical protein
MLGTGIIRGLSPAQIGTFSIANLPDRYLAEDVDIR